MTAVSTPSRGRVGDLVAITGHRLGEAERIGEILEVLGSEDHPRYRVRWDDEHESLFTPGSDATIRAATRRSRARKEKP